MSSLLVLSGYNTIQVYRRVGGSNAHPHTLVFEVCANTLVSEAWFLTLNQEQWFLNSGGYVRRSVKVSKKSVDIMMSREVLGLPGGVGCVVDQAEHKNHDILDNTAENLRISTQEQNIVNRSKYGSVCRFKGIVKNWNKFESKVRYNGHEVYLGLYKTDVEAALAYFYAGTLVYKEFFHGTEIPADEMPSEERQEEIWQLVLARLKKEGS